MSDSSPSRGLRRRALATKIEARLRSALASLDRAAARTDRAFAALRPRFFEQLWEDAAGAIGASSEPLGRGFLRIERAGVRTFVRDSKVELDTHLALEIAGDKPLAHRLLSPIPGYRAPRFAEFSVDQFVRARDFLAEADGAVVIKPARGTGAGRGVTAGVRSPADLRRAVLRGIASCPELLVEEQVEGHSYRLLFLDGELLDAVRRDPPRVTGDGRSSLRKLMDDETERRLAAAPTISLWPLECDLDCRIRLAEDGFSPRAVPAAGARVQVKSVVNQNAAHENHRVTEEVHASVRQLGRDIASELGIELLGLDVLSPDIAIPLEANGGVVNEANTTPGLHHHYLVADPTSTPPLAERILEQVLSRRAPRQSGRADGSVEGPR